MKSYFKKLSIFACLLAIILLIGCAGTNSLSNPGEWDQGKHISNNDGGNNIPNNPVAPTPGKDTDGPVTNDSLAAVGDYNSDGLVDLARLEQLGTNNRVKVVFGTKDIKESVVKIEASKDIQIKAVDTFRDADGDLLVVNTLSGQIGSEYLIKKDILSANTVTEKILKLEEVGIKL